MLNTSSLITCNWKRPLESYDWNLFSSLGDTFPYYSSGLRHKLPCRQSVWRTPTKANNENINSSPNDNWKGHKWACKERHSTHRRGFPDPIFLPPPCISTFSPPLTQTHPHYSYDALPVRQILVQQCGSSDDATTVDSFTVTQTEFQLKWLLFPWPKVLFTFTHSLWEECEFVHAIWKGATIWDNAQTE